jgi:translation initiation factor 6
LSVERLDFLGNPNVGVYSLVSGEHVIVPIGLPAKTIRIVERVLKVKAVEAKICQTSLLGIMLVGNSSSMIAPYLASDDEIEFLQESLGVKISKLTTSLTALGNIILANDNGAIVHPKLREVTMKSIESILGVKVAAGRIGRTGLVGSSAVATDKGALASPHATDEELDRISEVLGVPVSVGSVNRGVTYVRSGLLVNSDGAIAGRETTGPELDRIEESFELI